eukprot:TRINITY_DN15401_c0_g1_i1.p1 TRINITY_DN15401_c0_g1~~TRINITY_DN15401_c0_g1_i1.p1  ORF type:complete len:432 (+),score=72.43 TRINITY_DN15401_c0_g1_i1:54-1349(+)
MTYHRAQLTFARIVLGLLFVVSSWRAAGDEGGGSAKQKPAPSFPIPPDTRPEGCEAQHADPTGNSFRDLRVSIIIPYRNERLDHIKWTMESIFYYTPRRLIGEIIFVSDGNKPESIHLDAIRALSPLITVLVFPDKGVGLIQAKMRAVGATHPKSSVLVFLEPHIRVNRRWLEPLLLRLRHQPHALVMPALDPMPQDDFSAYEYGAPGHWRFEWNLNLIYTNPAEWVSWGADPIFTPATSGGIFAIRKDWWNKLELYDVGMVGWGGDHIEASFKVWRCGGRIEMVPCSRIGHLFRDPAHRPYAVPIDQVVKNYGRIAQVWLEGEYLEAFKTVKPEITSMHIGNVSGPKATFERLKCKSMAWYLDNVDRELKWELSRICIPGCTDVAANCCKDGAPAVPGRSCIAEEMPASEYVPLPSPLEELPAYAAHTEL